MNYKKISYLLLFMLLFASLNGQVIKSKTVYLKFDNSTSKSPGLTVNEKPDISFLSPSVAGGEVFNSYEPEIQIFAKVFSNQGIESVVVNSKVVDVSDNGQISQRLDLFPGENVVIVGALDKEGGYAEKRILINYSPVEVTLAEKVSEESKYYALIIGVDNYMDPAILSLDNAVRDAERLKEVLVSNYTFDKENIQFLKDPRREDIIYALDNLSRSVTPNDNLLIYYAGHGNFDKQANIGYWLPANARKISSADWFNNSLLVDHLKKINSKHTLLISDACFSGSIFKMRAAFADAPVAIEKLYEMPSRKAMTSGTLTEVPDESPFTKYLIERLSKSKDLYYSASDLFNNIRIAVINNSESVPQYGEIKNVGDQGGEFIFIRK
jgi:hypothetical protein